MDLRYSDLRNKIISDNPQLAIAQSQKKVAQLEYKEIRANRYPTISLNCSYNFIKTYAESGQVPSHQTQRHNHDIPSSMYNFIRFQHKKQENKTHINTYNHK